MRLDLAEPGNAARRRVARVAARLRRQRVLLGAPVG